MTTHSSTSTWLAAVGLATALVLLGLLAWSAGPVPVEAPDARTTSITAGAAPEATAAGQLQTRAADPDRPEQPRSSSETHRGDREAASDRESGAELSVRRLVVTSGIVNREPVPSAALFAGSPIVAFVELSNRASEDRKIVVTFEKEGSKVGNVRLPVPAHRSRWRTWAKTHLVRDAGIWHAVVRTAEGAELARSRFEVEPAPVAQAPAAILPAPKVAAATAPLPAAKAPAALPAVPHEPAIPAAPYAPAIPAAPHEPGALGAAPADPGASS